MPPSTGTRSGNLPLLAYNFRVEIAGVTMSFAEVKGLAIEHRTIEYQHGLSFVEGAPITKFLPERFVSVVLRRGVVQGVKVLSDWIKSSREVSVEVRLCDEKGIPAVTWHIGRAIAVKLEGPELDAAGNSVAIDTLELKAARITLEHH